MIIIGYQGIGKSTLAGQENCIDLESGNFWVDGKRADDWYIPYCQIANHLSEQGYTVFVSSHAVVREELKKSKERVVAVIPSVELKEKWIAKLLDRYLVTKLEKDYKAWKNAEDRYEENIWEIIDEDSETYLIRSMNYNLKCIVLGLRGEEVKNDESKHYTCENCRCARWYRGFEIVDGKACGVGYCHYTGCKIYRHTSACNRFEYCSEDY